MKLLQYLLEHNLAPDERTARGLIMRGDVLVDDKPVSSEHAEVSKEQAVRLRGKAPGASVSRGAEKLLPVVERTGFCCRDMACLDLGVATGGFTQVLLNRGARQVYAVDVAYGTIALELRNDPRVMLLERTNARDLSPELIPELIDRVVGDLSFISWEAVLPAVTPLVQPDVELLLMVKPQFELSAQGRGGELVDGVVVSPDLAGECLVGLYNTWVVNGLAPERVIPAGIRGAKGNQEYFAYLKMSPDPVNLETYTDLVKQAVNEARK